MLVHFDLCIMTREGLRRPKMHYVCTQNAAEDGLTMKF